MSYLKTHIIYIYCRSSLCRGLCVNFRLRSDVTVSRNSSYYVESRVTELELYHWVELISLGVKIKKRVPTVGPQTPHIVDKPEVHQWFPI